MQTPAKVFHDFNAVTDHAVDGHLAAALCSVASERSAGSALIPLHHGEEFFPLPEARPLRHKRDARASVQHQQDGVVDVFAMNLNPLVDAADFYEPLVGDPGGRRGREVLGDLMLPVGRVAEANDPTRRGETRMYTKCGFVYMVALYSGRRAKAWRVRERGRTNISG